jgi:hypothetical protein
MWMRGVLFFSGDHLSNNGCNIYADLVEKVPEASNFQ